MKRLAALGIAVIAGLASRPSRAATFHVTASILSVSLDPALEADALPGDGICATTAGTCVLAAALQEANALPGPDEIVVEVPTACLDQTVASEIVVRCAGRGVLSLWNGMEATTLNILPGGDVRIEDCRFDDGIVRVAGGRLTVTDSLLTQAQLELNGGELDIERSALSGPALVLTRDPTIPAVVRATTGLLTVASCRFGEVHKSWCQGGGQNGVIEIGTATAVITDTTFAGYLPVPSSTDDCWSYGIVAGPCQLTLERCRFTALRNSAILLTGTQATLRDVTIEDTAGGGMFINGAASVLLERVIIERTTWREINDGYSRAVGGVGLSIASGVVEIRSSRISHNASMLTGGCRGCSGYAAGGMLAAGNVHVYDTVFEGNSGADRVGGIQSAGTLTLTRCTISDNAGPWPRGIGGLVVVSGTARLVDCSVSSHAWTAIQVSGGSLKLLSTTLSANGVGLEVVSGLASAVNTDFAGNVSADCLGPLYSVGYLALENSTGCTLTGDVTSCLLGPGLSVVDGGNPSGCVDELGAVLAEDLLHHPRHLDGDLDGSAICDIGAVESCPPTPDVDGDTLGDQCDPCPAVAGDTSDVDGDGVGDACDPCTDTDRDGFAEVDSPPRTCELDTCPGLASAVNDDGDADGRGDACDTCPDLASADQSDPDGDGIGTPCDNCPVVWNFSQDDSDGDGPGDVCDRCPNLPDPGQPDRDGDYVGDGCDNCPDLRNDQEDHDRDGLGDACDACTDTDADGFGDPGFPASTCALDNCPSDVTLDHGDGDGDGAGDACDNCPEWPNRIQADADADGVGDACTTAFEPSPETGPNPIGVAIVNGRLHLTWTPPVHGIMYFDVHAGDLGLLHVGTYSHHSVACWVYGLESDVTMPAGSVYFLVVSRLYVAGTSSFGRDSLGRERPAGSGCP